MSREIIFPVVWLSCVACVSTQEFLNGWRNGIVVCAGNSLTFGYLLPDPSLQSYPGLLGNSYAVNSLRVTVFNKGVNGITTQQMIVAGPSQIDPLLVPGVKNVCVAWEIGNDIWFNGTDGATAYNNFKTYCLARQAAGWQVVVMTVPPRNAVSAFGDSPAQYMAKVNQANALLRVGYQSFSSGLVDIAIIPELAVVNPVYYYPDNIHIRANGYVLIEGKVSNQLFNN